MSYSTKFLMIKVKRLQDVFINQLAMYDFRHGLL
jgi:hypothetical protein